MFYIRAGTVLNKTFLEILRFDEDISQICPAIFSIRYPAGYLISKSPDYPAGYPVHP
jgi:hypothetical protein